MCSSWDKRSYALTKLAFSMVATLSCVNAVALLAYFYFEFRGLPPSLQGSTHLAILAFFLSIANICVGILRVIPPSASFLGKILVRGNELYGYGCLSSGAGCLLFWLNCKFAISPAYIASLMALAMASVFFGIDAKKLVVQYRAVRRAEK